MDFKVLNGICLQCNYISIANSDGYIDQYPYIYFIFFTYEIYDKYFLYILFLNIAYGYLY